MNRFLPFFLAAAIAAPVSAAPGPAQDGQPAKKICRGAGTQLGSRIRRPTVCRTAAEWEELDAARQPVDMRVKAPQPEPWERTRPQ